VNKKQTKKMSVENNQECFVVLLRAIVAVRTGISFWKINLKALDSAYSIVFPNSTPINVNKKKISN
jgi:hypothetical protein